MNNYILSFITWLPAIGAILILAFMKKDQSSLIKKFATGWFALDFLLSLWLLKYNRGVGGMQLYRAETPGPMKDSKLTPRITETARALWTLYVAITCLCALAYWLAGMTLFDAITRNV